MDTHLLEVHATCTSHARHATHTTHARHTAHAGHSSHSRHAAHASHAGHATHSTEVFLLAAEALILYTVLLILIHPTVKVRLDKWNLLLFSKAGPEFELVLLLLEDELERAGC